MEIFLQMWPSNAKEETCFAVKHVLLAKSYNHEKWAYDFVGV